METPRPFTGILSSIYSTSLLFTDSSSNRKGKQPSGCGSKMAPLHSRVSCLGPATKPARSATMRQKVISIFLCYLLLYTCGGVEAHTRKDSDDSNSGFWDALTYVAVGGGLLAMGLPALGFTATGIAANSWAASMMSWSAVANGGGVPAGGLVATLQSLGE
ncbi:interferon alpha inducible protein 6 [Phyllostomus discolor]|uniref:Interferon alpha inducible protein 6 n=1 Tax=Phyllostomus discolor TaxID=89673 RepID=A0A834AB60_9CHIR|nr:interferon alpha inducible protein 6 [Phyllostomus discolor]